ncbi:hypothetical protein DB88DRAFT_492759 [Papiliotrema laurentii]|uniref:Pre-mRNA polyadenylation factor Fip1 domain-containing protein n=1 Tax=Papiliotrema laurentii TaxID=5418 RepID=A0AAD9CYP2_PAPLA|nr:hypothetical protein DB88DRAFT_492759 [Papiliotrema laurentii]
MDLDDDDAFLYGDAAPPAAPAASAQQSAGATAQPSSSASQTAPSGSDPAQPESKASAAVSASMAASLAAYGIDPSTAVAAENPEDGGVEEEDPQDDDEDSDSDDEDDVKLVFSGQAQRLDLRKPQTAPSNVIGIGKWAHTSTGTAAPPAASPAAPATPRAAPPTANQTTEYTPTSRPGQTPAAQTVPNSNPPIPPAGDGSTTPNLATPQPSSLIPASEGQNLGLPPSTLPPVHANGYKIDPENPSGIIPSTGTSTYDIDLAQFEGSGQPWRRPGSDLQDWFNFGFDETSYPRFLRYRREMELGRSAMMNLPMGAMTPEVAQLLHLPNPMMAMTMGQMGQMPNMAQMAQMGQMGQMNMAQMAQMGFNPQQMQQMQQMGGFGMGMEGMGQQPQQQHQQQQQQQHPSQQQQQNQPRNVAQRTPLPEAGELVKQEEGVDNNAGAAGAVTDPRGQTAMRGGPAGRGVAMRGRGGAIPSGPRAGVNLPVNIPKGPKAGRFKDKDRVENSTSDLNYGDDETSYSAAPSSAVGAGGKTGGGSRSVSPSRSERRERSRRYRERSYDEGYDSRDSRRSRSRSRSASPRRDRERERSSRRSSRKDDEEHEYDSRDRERGERRKEKDARESRREKRKREEGAGAGNGALGPGGWESDEETRSR